MLIDTTLREGEQLYAAYFTWEEKAAMLEGLAVLGAEEIEVGYAGQEGLRRLLRLARRTAPGARLSVWCPCRAQDALLALDCGADVVHMGLPASDRHRDSRLHLTRGDLLRRLEEVLRRLEDHGQATLSLGLEDVASADPDYSLALAREARNMGVSRVRLADTLGSLTPTDMAGLMRRFRAELDCAVAVHCHNDFGMATANAVTALLSGADQADASLLGIGERAGVAALEELAAWLSLRAPERLRRRYDLSILPGLCGLVSRVADVAVPRTKAVVGRDIFAVESGLHAHGIGRDPSLFEPYAPEVVSARRVLALGKKSGRAAVRQGLSRLGLPLSEERLPWLVDMVRRKAEGLGRPLSDEEFALLAEAR
ncbi:pyruvate carboxyltransferase [Desulfovibrio aminophilus]|uniref:LeuA family protein n=1 Tax=Desulfovibrio aminophilus TaxID=81425 RepID=UPI00339816B4